MARYGHLRPHQASILTWCVEGRPWTDMIAILTSAGCRVSPAALQNHATRRGFVLLHPYSSHFNENVRAAFIEGKISAAELAAIFAARPGQPNKSR